MVTGVNERGILVISVLSARHSLAAPVLAGLLACILSGCGPGFEANSSRSFSDTAALASEGGQDESTPTSTNGRLKLDLKLDADEVDAAWNRKDDAISWNKITIKALEDFGPALLTEDPIDAKSFCPRYHRLGLNERGEFWVKLISAMAARESSFDEDLNYTEAFNDSSNTRVISRGLLQISKESALNYKCDIDVGRDLLKAENNIPCGVKILNHWMIRDKMIGSGKTNAWKGGARYWSVFRKDSTRSKIQASLDELEFCKARD